MAHITLGMLAALAVAGFGAATASAESLPEIVLHGTGTKFTSEETKIEVETGTGDYNCKSVITGEFQPPKGVGKVSMTLTSCANFCYGKLTFAPKLQGHVGYLSKANREIALELEKEGEHFGECEYSNDGYDDFASGSVIAKLTPANTITPSFQLEFNPTHWTRFEGEEAAHILELGEIKGPEQFKLRATFKIKPESEVEFKA
jgi:hypothetical protein